jgi:hypothetical protein
MQNPCRARLGLPEAGAVTDVIRATQIAVRISGHTKVFIGAGFASYAPSLLRLGGETAPLACCALFVV